MKAITKTLMILAITLSFTTSVMAAETCRKMQEANGKYPKAELSAKADSASETIQNVNKSTGAEVQADKTLPK
jgi:hypothetical protein